MKASIRPDFHDALLCGVMVRDDNVYLTIQPVSGGTVHVELRQARLLRVDGFLLGNIILDVTEEWCGTYEPAALLDSLESWFPDGLVTMPLVQGIIANNMLLVEMTPSYGCSLACVCVSMEITQELSG